jgi:hypothetical protein
MMPEPPAQPERRRRGRLHDRVFRMSSQAELDAAIRELGAYGLQAFKVHRSSTPEWLLLVVQVEDPAAAAVATRVVLAVDGRAERLPPLDR